MRLEEVTAELRPRSEWEAVDLGLAMVRRDFWGLAAAWWLGMLPVVAIALPLLREHPVWFCVVFWWWIPVASRLALFRLSRRLFGENPVRRELWRELPRAMKRRFFYRLLWARLSPWRPLTAAVEDLEGLRGKAFSTRCRVLMRRGDSSLTILAMWRVFLTFWLGFTVFATAGLFVPETASARWSEIIQLWFDGESAVPPFGLSLAIMGALCASMFVVDLFSIGAGFGIYLNHRTWVEGWDVELAFRRLGARLGGAAGALALALGLALGLALTGTPTAAAANDARAAAEIEEILEHDDFEVHEETVKSLEPLDWGWWNFGGGGGGALMEALAAILKFLVIGGGAAALIALLIRHRHWFRRGAGGGRESASPPAARVVMGMEVAEDSLPDDVVDAAREAWRAGRHHEALSLLYRGALAWVIGREGVPIAESDTESDCLRRVRAADAGHAEFFASLTAVWIALAYGRRVPEEATMDELCRRWPFREGGSP